MNDRSARNLPALSRLGRRVACAVLAGALTGCIGTPSAPPPSPEPVEAAPASPSAESRSFARYYASVEARLLDDGLLRTDGGRCRHSLHRARSGRELRADRAIRRIRSLGGTLHRAADALAPAPLGPARAHRGAFRPDGLRGTEGHRPGGAGPDTPPAWAASRAIRSGPWGRTAISTCSTSIATRSGRWAIWCATSCRGSAP